MPSADAISDTIEPGSLEYGDRQVVQDRIQQAMVQSQDRRPSTPGAVSQAAQSRLASGPVSDRPVTDGLSVGPGAGPTQIRTPELDPKVEQYRLIAANARNPQLRHLARSALRATITRG